jgi:succinate-semialdehyde dehydrogenase/glutarate-semialdehyde dehydrogenase
MSTQTVQTINPSTEEVIETYDFMSQDRTDELLSQAQDTFESWKLQMVDERAARIKSVGETLREHADELCDLMTREMGKVGKEAQDEVELCASICDYTAEHAARQLADETRPIPGGQGLITYQPIGVILGIQPWNFPLYQVVRYAIPNIAAGNTTLLKHAKNVWGMASKIQELFEKAGLPKGALLNMRTSTSQTEALIGEANVRGVTFTGSDGAGSHVAEVASKHMKKTVLELGSNDGYLILADADLDKAVECAIKGRFNNVGQTCVAAKRFIVEAAVYEDFRDAYLARIKELTWGDPTKGDVDFGPMARRDLRDTLHQQVMESIQKGATCVTGGQMPQGKGFFYPATLLEDVQPGQPAYDDELFGPVASLIKVKDADEAMRVANDSRYGLGGGIFSKDEKRAIKMARQHFDTGMVNINGYNLGLPNMPFGGVKNSGYGREHGGFGISEFINVKAIMIAQ